MTPIANYIETEDEAALAELKDISVNYKEDPREFDVVFVGFTLADQHESMLM